MFNWEIREGLAIANHGWYRRMLFKVLSPMGQDRLREFLAEHLAYLRVMLDDDHDRILALESRSPVVPDVSPAANTDDWACC